VFAARDALGDLRRLTALEFDVIEGLARIGSDCRSVVQLAAELWGPGNMWSAADPVGLVEYVVVGLGDQGVLTYRLHADGSGVPRNVRLTPLGWDLAGYPRAQAQVGRARFGMVASIPLHPGDLTDYRGQDEVAIGGPVECLPVAEHRRRYARLHQDPEDWR
jgi:hypothetical protein